MKAKARVSITGEFSHPHVRIHNLLNIIYISNILLSVFFRTQPNLNKLKAIIMFGNVCYIVY